MNGKKRAMLTLLVLMIAAAVILGLVWSMDHYVLVGSGLYPKDAETIDLRGKEVKISQYEALREKFPETKIYWNVPFQGKFYDQGNRNLTISSLSERDLEVLDYFPQLERVDARACRDYENLLALKQRRPEVAVDYQVEIGGSACSPDAREVVLSSVTREETALLQYLPELKTVAFGGEDLESAEQLRAYCQEHGYDFRVQIGQTAVALTDSEITIQGAGEGELKRLRLLPNLKSLHLENPEAPVECLLELEQTCAGVEVSWSAQVAGKTFDGSDTLIDISGIPVTDLSEIEKQMTYFPQATQLEMHQCGVDNEEMAAFREAHREDYKVVWTVNLGPKLPTRTDVTSIMPARDGTSDFHDEDAYNMRYCEDVIAIDIGHLDVRNIEFVRYMPHLKYLIVSWTGVNDLTPISNCKELVFFEGTDAPIGDLTPLLGCTALEDINLSASGAKNGEVLAQMPWLKNVWVIQRGDLGWPVTRDLPDTYVRASGTHTVSGWRSIPNYFKMRDALGMFYMNG